MAKPAILAIKFPSGKGGPSRGESLSSQVRRRNPPE